MRFKLALAVPLALIALAGCGSKEPTTTLIPSQSIHLPPESARHPEGYKPASPPPPSSKLTLTSTHISTNGLHLIEGFEGFSSCPYWDIYGRVWTRGYGETEGITAHSPCLTRAQGEANLKRLVETRYEWALRGLGVTLNQNQWDALCSFVYNVGAGIFQGTTVGADLRARRFFAATRVMLQYDHAGGVVLPGLRTRREAEVRLFLTPVPTPHPCRTQCRHRRLGQLYARRRVLRGVLRANGCRLHPGGPGRHGRRCNRWTHELGRVQVEIHRLGGR